MRISINRCFRLLCGSIIPSILFVCLLIAAGTASEASFTITTGSTTAQTLGSGSGQTGLITTTGSLNVSGATVAVTISGNNATLTNQGVLIQSGSGRAIRDNTGVTGLLITNTTGALMQTADADVIQMNKSPASVTLNNYGSMISLNASAGGSQAVDFAAIASGANTISNYSTGLMKAYEADTVRPGVNGVVYNAGTMLSITTVGNSSDGVDAQNNTGVQITNDSTGLIEGGRHGITGGAVNNTVTFTTSVTNNLGGIIKGDNGSGINLDGFNANQTATIVNHGTITGYGHDIGDGVSHDGDGIDVDGIVNLTNTGTIRSINSFNVAADGVAYSEGVTVGGGTIINSGTIEGLVASGNANAVGRGISLLGNDITTGTLAGTREAIYGNAVVTNQTGGFIRGDSDSGIAVDGPASGFTVTINNNAGATIRGGATLAGLAGTNAAIRTGADNDTINNAGTIDGSSNGKAIDMGAGNNTLHITGGSASILGDISGGVGGANAMTISPGSGNSFSYAGSISNFSSVEVQSGNVTFSGSSGYSGNTTVTSGTLVVHNSTGSATGSGTVTVKSLAALKGDGTIGGDVSIESGGILSPGMSPGNLTINGSLTITGSSKFVFELGTTSDLVTVGDTLIYSGSGAAIFDIVDEGIVAGNDYTLIGFSSESGLDVSDLAFGNTPAGFSGTFEIISDAVTLHVDSVPEPSSLAAIGIGAFLLLAFRKHRRV